MSYEEFLFYSMSYGYFLPLGSIEAIRPVFMIVMGVFLMVITWRLSKTSEGWTARLIVSGAILLGLGYAVVLPLYDAGVVQRYSPLGSTPTALAWHVVKLMIMNLGWLLFGIGLALHAQVFSVSPSPKKQAPSPLTPSREFIA